MKPKKRFTAGDFLFGNVKGDGVDMVAQASADRANAKLIEWETECERVYYTIWSGKPGRICSVQQKDSTDTALLWNVEKVEGEE